MLSLTSLASFSIDVLGPVVVLIAFGYFLGKRQLVTDHFVEVGSNLIFTFALPALLFINLSTADLSSLIDVKSISAGVSGTLLVFILSLMVVSFFVTSSADKGVMVQGIFRANMGIIGLAYCTKAYGSQGLALASVYMGVLTIVYNTLSVAVLNLFQQKHIHFSQLAKGIASNPIILSIVLGMGFALLHIRLPEIAVTSLNYFAQLTLPLALICTGAALKFRSLGQYWKLTLMAIIGKCLVYPVIVVSLALWMRVDGMTLGILFLMAMCPTAAASYVMVRKIGGNHQLAAQIIALSTVASLPMTIIGFAILQQFADINL